MFFFLSKIFDLLLAPLTWALLLAGASFVPRVRVRPGSRWLMPAALGILYAFSLQPVSQSLFRACEQPPMVKTTAGPPYDAVILLGGLVLEDVSAERGAPAFNDNVERLTETFELLREGRARAVIISGGSWRPRAKSDVEAAVLARTLVRWGIEQERIIVEDRSRNTQENAAFTAEIVRARHLDRLLLVTSAFHMPRAHATFRAAGLAPDTLPVDFRTGAVHLDLRSVFPRADDLSRSTDALRELAGRLVYRARGYSSAR